MNLFDLISAQAIATYWTESASNRIPYLGSAIFPSLKRSGLDLSWFKGYNDVPIALKPSAFDAKAPIRDRIAMTKVETEMPFFREGMTIKEKERQEILKVQNSNEAFWRPILNNIYNDRANLVAGALVQSERMRMQLLSTGKIYISANNLIYEYNYDPSGTYEENNIIDVTIPWSTVATSTPVTDLQEAMQDAEDRSGTRPSIAIMSMNTWKWLLGSAQIKMDMNVQNGQNIILTDTMLQQYFSAKLGLQIVVYNKKYRESVTWSGGQAVAPQHSFFPDGVVSLIPSGTLGNTWYGTTPEEADLAAGQSYASVAIVNTGIAVTSIVQPHPVNVETIVSQIVLPSYERMDETTILRVIPE